MPFDKIVVEDGVTLAVNISFTKTEDDDYMEVLSVSVNDGYKCVDYAMVVEETKLVDIIKDFAY